MFCLLILYDLFPRNQHRVQGHAVFDRIGIADNGFSIFFRTPPGKRISLFIRQKLRQRLYQQTLTLCERQYRIFFFSAAVKCHPDCVFRLDEPGVKCQISNHRICHVIWRCICFILVPCSKYHSVGLRLCCRRVNRTSRLNILIFNRSSFCHKLHAEAAERQCRFFPRL